MIAFASICPHPPIIIPEIGGQELKKCQKTVSAMKKLADIFKLAKPDTVIIITPHGPVQTNKMTILSLSPSPHPKRKKGGGFLNGSFWQFGHPEVKMQFADNPELADKIKKSAQKADMPIETVNFSELDHGVLVPMYYLYRDALQCVSTVGTGRRPVPTKLIPIAFSYLSLKTHFQFGQIIGQIIKKEKSRIAVIASGDLSHRLTPDAPAGFSPRGRQFDKTLISLLQKNDVNGILNLEADLIEEAGECGLRSIIILLGVLSNYQYKPQILSYEGPFGVGYAVINFFLKRIMR